MKKKAKKRNTNKILNIIIYSLIGISLINLIYYIFVGSKCLMNTDSSFIVDYSLEQIRTHSLFPRNWINTNDFWIYSLIPLITLFLKFGFSLFLSRQISVFIQTSLMILIFVDLFKNQLKYKSGTKFIILILLSGVSGQFMFEIFGDATYGSIAFYMMLELWIYIKYINTQKKRYLTIFGIILMLLCGFSLRFPIYIAAPIICYSLYSMYNDGLKKENVLSFFIIVIAVLIGYLINKYLNSQYILASFSLNKTINDSNNLFTNSLLNTINNFIQMCGVSNVNVKTLNININNNFILTTSPLVVLFFIRFIYMIVTIILPFKLFKKINKMEKSEKIIYVFVISYSFIMLFFLTVARMDFWYRYISIVIFSLNLLYPLAYKYYFKEAKDKIVFKIGIILFSITSLFFVFASYYDVENKKVRENYYQHIANYLESKNLKYGYVYGDMEPNIYRLISNNRIQVNRIHQFETPYFWLNSVDWYSEEYYSGKTFYMRMNTDPEFDFEKESIEKYEFENYIIFVFENHNDILKYLGTIEYVK